MRRTNGTHMGFLGRAMDKGQRTIFEENQRTDEAREARGEAAKKKSGGRGARGDG